MEGIRLATPEEIEAIKTDADLGPTATAIVWDASPDVSIKAVLRQATEIDPVFFGSASNTQKAMFIWGVSNMLRFIGRDAYYFNVKAEDTAFQEFMKHQYKAEQVSKEPELRLKVTL